MIDSLGGVGPLHNLIEMDGVLDLGINISSDNPTCPPNLYFDSGLYVGFSEQGPTKPVNNTFGVTDAVSFFRGKHNLKMALLTPISTT